jgi:hypothetical protein
MTNRVHRAAEGEKNAKRYLLDHGFTILGEQVHISKKLTADGTTIPFTLRADFLVQKGRRKAIVDAKSGLIAADPKNPETRRRMFEYYYYYYVKEAYIYDDVRKTLKKIVFSDVIVPRGGWKWFIAGTLCSSLLFLLYLIISNRV